MLVVVLALPAKDANRTFCGLDSRDTVLPPTAAGSECEQMPLAGVRGPSNSSISPQWPGESPINTLGWCELLSSLGELFDDAIGCFLQNDTFE